MILWRHLTHPNILPFYRVCMDQDWFSIVSPWMENSNVLSYIRKNPKVNGLHQ